MIENGESSNPSLSKGVFVFKPNCSRQSPSKRAKKQRTEPRRKMLYRTIWESLEKELSAIRDRASFDAIEFVTNFVQPLNDEKKPSGILKSIPTAALLMGVNIPDHNSVFVTLIERLSEMENLCISLQSKDCNSLSAMIQKAVSSLMKPPYSFEDDAQEEELNVKKHNCTFQTLAAWYEEKSIEASTNQRIVIMLEDIESFKSDILQDFILICSQYIERLPIVFVFGIATAMVSLHSLLSQKVTSRLVIEVFCSPKATDVLNDVFEMVLTYSVPFRIGPKVFNYAKDIVVFQDFSTSNFTRLYKYCLWDHFYSNPASILVDFYDGHENLTKKEMKAVREIPSLKTYIQSLPTEERSLAENDTKLLEKVNELLNDLQIYDSQLNILLDCLLCIVKDLHGQPLGKYLVDIYCLMNKVPIIYTEDYQLAMKLLNLLSLDDLETKLQLCFHKLSDVVETYPQLMNSVNKIKHLLIEFPSLSQFDDLNDHEDVKTKKDVLFGGKTSLADLKAKLKDQIDNKKIASKTERWKFNVINALNELFGCIALPNTVPLNEVMFYDELHLLKDQLFPAPKAAIHHALMDPKLGCECCVLSSKDEICPTMPPICIAYKIHLEFAKSINIYDWLQSYIAKRMENASRKRGKKKAEQENLYQAEFFQALSELQILGVVKAPKRKSDYVTRLTWGPC